MAGQGMGPGPGVKGYASSGPPITYYFNADSATSGQPPTIGTGTLTIGAGVSTTTGVVSNAIVANGTWGRGPSFPVSGNLSYSTGTMGFWINDTTVNACVLFFAGQSQGTQETFSLYYTSGDYRWSYRGSTLHLAIPANTATYIELAWDTTKMSYRINGGSWTEKTDVEGTAPSATTFSFGSDDGTTSSFWFDQFLISSVYQADLFSVKNNTSF